MRAVVQGRTDVAKLLIEAGADVNAGSLHDLPYRTAATISPPGSVFGVTSPLSAAAFQGHVDVAKLLIKAGADINVKDSFGGTAFMYAVDGGHADIVKLLIEAGADINAKLPFPYGGRGYTALMRAAALGDTELVKVLIEAGADVNAEERIYSETALLVATKEFYEEAATDVQLMKILIEAGADVNAKDRNGDTALVRAVAAGDTELVKVLVGAGADVHAECGITRATALDLADDSDEIARILRAAGAR